MGVRVGGGELGGFLGPLSASFYGVLATQLVLGSIFGGSGPWKLGFRRRVLHSYAWVQQGHQN